MIDYHPCVSCKLECACVRPMGCEGCWYCGYVPPTPEDMGTATNDYDVVMPGDMLVDVDPGDEDDSGR